jgi:hypothetical protein
VALIWTGEDGLKAQLAPCGRPEHAKETLPATPAPPTWIVVLALDPADRVALDALEDEYARPTPAATPVPVRAMVCGLPAALSVMVSVPVELPRALGEKLTLMTQLPAVGTETPQLFVSVKVDPET